MTIELDVGPRAPDAPDATTPPPEQAWPSAKTSYYSLFVLTIVVMFTVLDRQVLALLIEPIKADFHISDTQAALLLGAAFSLTYAFAGLPIARIADVWNRRNLVAICLAFWSVATMSCGLAHSYAQLFAARLGIGIGESGYGPATWSIVTDSFPREKVAFATGTLGIGANLGTGMALFLGGAVLAMVAHFPNVHLPIVGVVKSWQWTFLIVGAPGLVWSLVVLTTKEPGRRGLSLSQTQRAAPIADVVRHMRGDWRSYAAAIGGLAMKMLMGVGSGQWMPTFFYREFHWPLAKIGLIQGAMTLAVAPIGMFVGGWISEKWTLQGRADANLRIVLYGLLISVPISIVTPLMPNPWLVLGLSPITLFIASVGAGPGIAAFQIITPNRMRAQVSATSQFFTNVVAFALGPLIVALFTDFLFRDPHQLKYSMALSAAVLGPVTILVVLQGMRSYARSYERAVRDLAW